MSKKMNLKNLTMAFATAAAVPTPAADVEATRAMVTQKIAEIKQKKAKQTDPTPEVKEPKVKAATKVKEPKEPKPAKVVEEGEDKLFTVAGCSTKKGVTKLRFANDLVARTKILDKDGHTDIKLFEMPKAMSKAEIVEYFKSNPDLGIDATALFNKEDAMAQSNKKSALTTPAE